MTDERSNWLFLGIISFFGAIVANIVFPKRRGVSGFLSATVVGVACGCTAGMTALAYEVHPGTQLVVMVTANPTFGDLERAAAIGMPSQVIRATNHQSGSGGEDY